MWTKQQQAFCITCGRNTNHVTHYQKDDVGGQLIAEVQCAEHNDVPVRTDQHQAVRMVPAAESAA